MYTLYLLPTNTSQINTLLKTHSSLIFKKKSIPPVVSLKKDYTNFTIDFPKTSNLDLKYILLTKEIENTIQISLEIKKEKYENEFIKNVQSVFKENRNEIVGKIVGGRDEECVRMGLKWLCVLEHVELNENRNELIENSNGSNQNYENIEEFNNFINSSNISDLYSIKSKILQFLLPHSYETLNRVILLDLNPLQTFFKNEISSLIFHNSSPKSIFLKKDKINNLHRTTEYEYLQGVKDNVITYKESNLIFTFDLNKVYFNSKLNTIRNILLEDIKSNEIVVDLFCGIGPVALRCLKKKCLVVANDINEDAVFYLKKNIERNGIKGGYRIFNRCAYEVIEILKNECNLENNQESYFESNRESNFESNKENVLEKKSENVQEKKSENVLENDSENILEKKSEKNEKNSHHLNGNTKHEKEGTFLDLDSQEKRSSYVLESENNHFLTNKKIDHFVLNLPEKSIYFIKALLTFKESKLHCFFFCKKNKNIKEFLKEEIGIIIDEKWIISVRDVAPNKVYCYLRVGIREINKEETV